MREQQIAGMLLIAGFLLVMVASFVGPNDVYTAPDGATRLRIIEKNAGRWRATNLIWAFGALVTAAGMALLIPGMRKEVSAGVVYAAAASFTIGAVAWAIYAMQRIGDPAGNLYTSPPAPLSLVFAYATMLGLALYGLGFLLGSTPDWLGYLLLTSMVLLAGGFILAFEAVYKYLPPQLFSLLCLIVGIVALLPTRAGAQ